MFRESNVWIDADGLKLGVFKGLTDLHLCELHTNELLWCQDNVKTFCNVMDLSIKHSSFKYM